MFNVSVFHEFLSEFHEIRIIAFQKVVFALFREKEASTENICPIAVVADAVRRDISNIIINSREKNTLCSWTLFRTLFARQAAKTAAAFAACASVKQGDPRVRGTTRRTRGPAIAPSEACPHALPPSKSCQKFWKWTEILLIFSKI